MFVKCFLKKVCGFPVQEIVATRTNVRLTAFPQMRKTPRFDLLEFLERKELKNEAINHFNLLWLGFSPNSWPTLNRTVPWITPHNKVGIVSCIIPYYFNPWGTGSHLLLANTNTLRGESLCRESLTWLSWATLSLGLLSLSHCIYYITLCSICQEVFYIFLEKVCATFTQRGHDPVKLFLLTFTIISQTFRFVNTFFKNFFVKEEFPLSCYLGTDFHSTHFLSGSLTTVIISQQVVFVKCFFKFFSLWCRRATKKSYSHGQPFLTNCRPSL